MIVVKTSSVLFLKYTIYLEDRTARENKNKRNISLISFNDFKPELNLYPQLLQSPVYGMGDVTDVTTKEHKNGSLSLTSDPDGVNGRGLNMPFGSQLAPPCPLSVCTADLHCLSDGAECVASCLLFFSLLSPFSSKLRWTWWGQASLKNTITRSAGRTWAPVATCFHPELLLGN